MIGRQMLGKVLYRAEEIFEDPKQRGPFPDRDCMLSGDTRQAPPVVDEPLYKKGPYTGRAENRPKRDNVDAPTMQSLVARAEMFRDSFADVVILREVHRVEREMAGLSAEEADRYRDEADRFLEVLGRLADLRWDPQKDWQFLQSRNRSILRRTPEGRQELEEFKDAPNLVDTRKKRNAGI